MKEEVCANLRRRIEYSKNCPLLLVRDKVFGLSRESIHDRVSNKPLYKAQQMIHSNLKPSIIKLETYHLKLHTHII